MALLFIASSNVVVHTIGCVIQFFSRLLNNMAADMLLLDRYVRIRLLGKGTYGEAWEVMCLKDRLPSGVPVRRGQRLVAKICDISGTTVCPV